MERILAYVSSLPMWQLATGAGVLAVILAGVIWHFVGLIAFSRQLRAVARTPDLSKEQFLTRYSPKTLLRRSNRIEKMAAAEGAGLVAVTRIDDLWLERLVTKESKRDLRRVLRWVAPKGLFQCFVVVMNRARLSPLLLEWLRGTEGNLNVHKLAVAGKGEDFDGRMALVTFRDHLDEIREMTGDPEWPSRYFAIKILLHDADDRSERALWEAFADAHPLVRRTVAVGIATGQRGRLYGELKKLLLDDPIYEVRRAVWNRIHQELPDLYDIEPEGLGEVAAYHVLELLRANNKRDEDLAIGYLGGENKELRFSAARYLERSGALDRLAQEVDLGDREILERNYDLLKKASEVGVTAFLGMVERTSRPATLLVCARILSERGSRPVIGNLARKVFTMYKGETEQQELYRTTIQATCKRGPNAALTDLNRELLRRRGDDEVLSTLLEELPAHGDYIFSETLIGFLKDPHFGPKAALRECIRRVCGEGVLPVVFEILQSERDSYPHDVRIQAVQLLGELQLPYCIQTVLENLPILPLEQAAAFTEVLAKLPKSEFVSRVEGLLATNDAKVRAAIIAAIPATRDQDFLRVIRPSLKDADPDVRIATVWALVEMGDTRSINQAIDMLRDPVDRVRAQVARAIGTHGNQEAVALLQKVLEDENEVASVKKAAIMGLGESQLESAVDDLVACLAGTEDLQDEVVRALAGRTERRPLSRLIENFKDADPQLREKMTAAFKAMGEDGEKAIAELLEEDLPSLHPFLVEILEATGHVESRIRRLAHRDPVERRRAAQFLARVGSRSAFRGIVLAARDPDEQVRIQVIKALERLATVEGKELLEDLQNDPDRKVRTYTAWAMERLRAKSIE